MDEDEIKSRILHFVKRYATECLLLTAAFASTALSLYLYNKERTYRVNSNARDNAVIQPAVTSLITAEVSGSVKHPGIYHITQGTRLQELIRNAGGLDEHADTSFFSRNFNLARFVLDQDKIHIPSYEDVVAGIYKEREFIIDYRAPQQIPVNDEGLGHYDGLVHLNSAMKDELEALPGIGPSLAEKIISNRPYVAVEDLISKKAVTEKVFQQIKGYIAP
jgi:competence protein ComEA